MNGRTDPSAEELKRLMMTHGGTYHHYMSSRLMSLVVIRISYVPSQDNPHNCEQPPRRKSPSAERLGDYCETRLDCGFH